MTLIARPISVYGTVGLSLGYPNVDQSFSYNFSTISKVVLLAMMIRGRHRGLPYSLDRAIMFPNDNMHRKDEAQEHHAINCASTVPQSCLNCASTVPQSCLNCASTVHQSCIIIGPIPYKRVQNVVHRYVNRRPVPGLPAQIIEKGQQLQEEPLSFSTHQVARSIL